MLALLRADPARTCIRDDYPEARARPRALRRPSPSATAACASLLADMALEPPTDSVGDVLAARRRGRGAAHALDHPLGQGARVAHRLRDLGWSTGASPRTYTVQRRRRDRGGAPAAVRRGDARQGAPLPDLSRSTSTTAAPAWCSASRRASSRGSPSRCCLGSRWWTRRATGGNRGGRRVFGWTCDLS